MRSPPLRHGGMSELQQYLGGVGKTGKRHQKENGGRTERRLPRLRERRFVNSLGIVRRRHFGLRRRRSRRPLPPTGRRRSLRFGRG